LAGGNEKQHDTQAKQKDNDTGNRLQCDNPIGLWTLHLADYSLIGSKDY